MQNNINKNKIQNNPCTPQEYVYNALQFQGLEAKTFTKELFW